MSSRWAAIGVLLLTLAHHDFWWWDDDTLLLGFVPVGLAYHAFYCCLCAAVWSWIARSADSDGVE